MRYICIIYKLKNVFQIERFMFYPLYFMEKIIGLYRLKLDHWGNASFDNNIFVRINFVSALMSFKITFQEIYNAIQTKHEEITIHIYLTFTV